MNSSELLDFALIYVKKILGENLQTPLSIQHRQIKYNKHNTCIFKQITHKKYITCPYISARQLFFFCFSLLEKKNNCNTPPPPHFRHRVTPLLYYYMTRYRLTLTSCLLSHVADKVQLIHRKLKPVIDGYFPVYTLGQFF